MKKLFFTITLCMVLLSFFSCSNEKKQTDHASTLFKNATLISGTGDPGKVGDILVETEKL